MQSATTQKVSVVGTILLHVRIGDCRVNVVFGNVRNSLVPVLLEASFSGRFVKGIFPTALKIVLFNYKAVPTIVIKELPEENKDGERTQNLKITK